MLTMFWFGLVNQSQSGWSFIIDRLLMVGCMTSPFTNRSLVVDTERDSELAGSKLSHNFVGLYLRN